MSVLKTSSRIKLRPDPLPAMQVVELKGYEYVKISTLAKTFDVSIEHMKNVLSKLQETHEIKAVQIGEATIVVCLADARRAILERLSTTLEIQKSL